MRKKYPSQMKYEKNNPTITFRVKTHEYEQIKQMVYKSGKNISELVRIALLGLEKEITTVFENGREVGNQQGYDEGYTKGIKDRGIWITCYICKKPIDVLPESDTHLRIIYMTRGLVRHGDCFGSLS